MRPHYITPPPEEVLPLFAQPAARRTDPETSHQAAKRMRPNAARQKELILVVLRDGPAGVTEIASRIGTLNSHEVGKRVSELDADSRITQTGRMVRNAKGNLEREWQLTACSSR
jgi:hypothetical protein